MNGTSTEHVARIRLARLLCEAAEIEHGLMCQYLFAAFSLKRGLDEGIAAPQLEKIRQWEASILLVARQEMEHLGLVCNLLTAIGEAPYLQRPNFPLNLHYAQLETPCLLEPLGLPALERFIQFEMPEQLSDEHDAQLREIFGPTYHHYRYTGIATLYGEIEALFGQLRPEDFVGPVYTQLTNDVAPGARPVGGRGYDLKLQPVQDSATGVAAIRQIVAEGEGTGTSTGTDDPQSRSHFDRFLEIYGELASEVRRDPLFAPARNVGVRSDDALPARGWPGELVAMFNLAYETLLMMLLRFIVAPDDEAQETSAMQQAAFFPMMTVVIRPLGELLTRVPLGDDGYASARFWFERPVALLPDSRAAFFGVRTRLGALADHARRLADPPEPIPAGFAAISSRLLAMAANLDKMERDFVDAAQIDP